MKRLSTGRRRLISILGAIAVVTSLVVVITGQSAHAYDSLDPYDTGCANGAYAVAPAYIAVGFPNKSGNTGFGYLHLMWSPSCQTNWAEFDSYPRGIHFYLMAWYPIPGSSGFYVEKENWVSNGDEIAWTDMVLSGSAPAGVGVCETDSQGFFTQEAWLYQSGAGLPNPPCD